MKKMTQRKTAHRALLVLLMLLFTLGLPLHPSVVNAFDAPPKDQGHTGPGAGNGDPDNPNGPNQGEGGDPIHVRGGNFTTAQEDLLILGHAMPLLVKRTYNSHDNYYEGPFGFGWSFSYNVIAKEVFDGNGKSQVIVRDGDGVEHVFTHNSGNNYDAPNGRYNKLTKIGVNAYQIVRKDAVKLLFSKNRLDAIIDPNGNQLTLSYTSDGKLSSVENPSNRTINISYGSNNKIEKVSDQIGRSVNYAYDGNGNLIGFTNTAGEKTKYTYDGNHHLISIIDPNNTTRLNNTYDSNAQVTKQISDGRTFQYNYQPTYTRVQVPGGQYVYHYFNGQGNTIRRTDQLNNNTYFVYGADSNLTQETDARGNVTKYAYDTLGNISTITDADNKVTTYATDPVFGVLTKVTDSLGRITSYQYDNKGNLTKKTDALGLATLFEYNSKGQVIKTTDENGKNLQMAYNANGDLISITNHRSETTSFEHDAVGRRIKLINPLGHTSNYSYDAMDRLLNSANALGQTVSYSYDKLGNIVKVTDPNGNFITNVYNQYGLLIAVVDPEGNSTAVSYDANGNIVQITDPLGNKQSSGFDAANRLISVKKADNSVTLFAYDQASNNTRITDPLGYQTNFSYDKFNRLINTSYADNTTESKSYDLTGNVVGYRDRAGNNFTFSYDNLDRFIKKKLPSSDEELISYDNIGFINSVSNKNGTINYSFDNADRLTSVQDVFGNNFVYEYDEAGRRIKLTDSEGVDTNYEYDDANRLIQVTRQSAITKFSYDAAGQLVSRILPNGVISEYAYDKRGLITQLIHKKPDGALIANYQYNYDATGKRTQVIEIDGSKTSYKYDLAYRLIQETKLASDQTIIYDKKYEYDVNGNRTKIVADSTIAYTYNKLNQLISDDVASYNYDANGNLIQIIRGTDLTEYQYDDENQLVKIHYPDNSELVSKYDAEGKLIQQDVSGQTKHFVFDGSALYGEISVNGSYVVKYNRSLGLISQRRGINSSYYLTDALGSVRQLAGASGNITDAYNYDGFGNVTSRTGVTNNAYQFAGNWGYYQQNSLTHIGARFYSPTIGRFLSVDPLHQGVNWYAYAFNDPVNRVDPDGRWVHVAIGAGVGAVINTGVYLYSTPRSDWSLGGGARAAATGAIVGGVGAATFGASMPATLGGAVARGALSGLAGQAASDLTNSAIDQKLQISSPWTYAGAAAGGGVLAGAGYGLNRALQNFGNSANGANNVGYHATHPDAAESILQNGFRPGTKPGRLGSGGTYVNNTPEGAIAEFAHHNPGVKPAVLQVEYNAGVNANASVPPNNYVSQLPLNVDSISAPSLRAPGTVNTNIINGSARPTGIFP
ncbi:MAG: RHS repeat protein [Methylomicrobium sp.]|nr:RHS repeat protein [Methylomicrobium sp.]